MDKEKIAKVKAEAVEEYRKGIVDKVGGIYKILRITEPMDNSGELTQEEMLAIKSGAISAYTYVLGLLGADGEQTERGARKSDNWMLATNTILIGAEIHDDELKKRDL